MKRQIVPSLIDTTTSSVDAVFIFVDESEEKKTDSGEPTTLVTPAVIAPQEAFSRRIHGWQFFQGGKRGRIGSINRFLEDIDGYIAIGLVQRSDPIMTARQKVWFEDESYKLSHADFVWSCAVEFTVSVVLVNIFVRGYAFDKVEVHYDRKDMPEKHREALEAGLKSNLANVANSLNKEFGVNPGRNIVFQDVRQHDKADNWTDAHRFQKGIWIADQVATAWRRDPSSIGSRLVKAEDLTSLVLKAFSRLKEKNPPG